MNYLQELEAEAIYVFREIAAQFKKPVLLFSGGKDSTLLIHLAAKAFYPMPIPFPVMHVDTGHNFEEALRFRDQLVQQKGLKLIVRKVEDSIIKYGIEEPVEKLP
ncbi:MAG: phosphoadenosine phosphosulfate reductase domain-containing protein, partial [Flavipsychrobacter sp.]